VFKRSWPRIRVVRCIIEKALEKRGGLRDQPGTSIVVFGAGGGGVNRFGKEMFFLKALDLYEEKGGSLTW